MSETTEQAQELLDIDEMAQYLKLELLDPETDEEVNPVEVLDMYGYPHTAFRMTPDMASSVISWLSEAVDAFGRGCGFTPEDRITAGTYGVTVYESVKDGRDRDNYPTYRDESHYLSPTDLCDPYGAGVRVREAKEQAAREKQERERAESARRHAASVAREREFRRQNLEMLAAEFGYSLIPEQQEQGD
jgi:hypothetical protein